jgi:O-antigen ligase
MRYFSVYSDAANYGCSMGATSVAFYIFALTNKVWKDRLFFLIVALAATWGMFQSGTRTAMFCMIVGFATYVVLSKSVKIAVPVTIFFALFVCMLAFTKIGNGNDQIRRMRTAFDKNDVSKGAREANKEAMKKYMTEAPWGIGLGISGENCPQTNKFYLMAVVPPDSEYVNIWIRTGIVGLSVYLTCLALILIGGCCIVFFKIKNRALQGIGAGICCAFAGFQVGAYGNQVLMQFPNGIIYFGGMAIVYILPYIEGEYAELEAKKLALQEERRQLKLEKKKQSRV